MAEDTYSVGYRKPPRHSQFRKGQSGFRGRRHKANKSASDYLDATLSERISVVEGGRTIRLTRLEVFLRQLVARGINGDRQAAKLLFDYVSQPRGGPQSAQSSITDDFLIGEVARMMGETSGEGTSDGEQ